ncbi:GNAT family N-acetyltransferase [Catenuloplanes atrovinosus]|uniref:GNAT superfamily N-acetyltransferase n=1 Tax=Catenuloplanes atrovinosus TaxID=137266 RepID=A0AAE3YN60_9ACTN|nr:GNAT family N-acetyltransferase [Catenuloplanes atrovinosus]MDR7274866.1 GNAT superfamily N-acetyltransferase [Catenuloplanes atrovinosus]
MEISPLTAEDHAAAEIDLAEVLLECVLGGASVGFTLPFTVDDARAYWRDALAEADARTWVARDHDGRILGVVRLLPAAQANAPHRAEIAKLLVHPDGRGRGLGGALLVAAEEGARALGRTLLVLDTQTGGVAEGLYARRGWTRVGEIPEFALTPTGDRAATTIFRKHV